MFFNLKYHIVSLVAVFLALGLGILIGSTIPGSDALYSKQQQLTSSLEQQLGSLKQKNLYLQSRVNTLEMDNNIQRQFEYHVLPVLLGDKLEGRKIAIIGTTGQPLGTELVKTLSMSGAEIQSVTIFNGMQSKDQKKLLESLQWPATDEKTTIKRIAREIAQAVLTGSTDKMNSLAALKVIRMSGTYGGPVDDVILVGGCNDKNSIHVDSLDLPLIDLFKEGGLQIVGVEESLATFSFIKEYQKKGISTVDNADTVPGQVSLVYALMGNTGQYGVKATARSPWPAMEGRVPVSARKNR